MTNQNDNAAGKIVTGTVPEKEDVISMLGEGLHTGLRKGTDKPSSSGLWRAIAASNDGAWPEALEYLYWGLRYSGWEIVKVTPEEAGNDPR